MRWTAKPAGVGLGVALGGAARAGAGLEAVAFMTGCWRGAFGNGSVIEESYGAADSDVMLGTTRYLRDGRTRGWEFSRIHADSAGVFLTPYPDGRRSEHAFRLVRAEPGHAVFENLEHDFPKRIIYRRPAADSLVARIEDDARGREWRMAAVPCAGR
jgi:hypothetical protein